MNTAPHRHRGFRVPGLLFVSAFLGCILPVARAQQNLYWTGGGTKNTDSNLEWADVNNWNVGGYATGIVPVTAPSYDDSPAPYDNVFLNNSGTTYLGGVTATNPGTDYQRINNLTIDGGYNNFGGRYTRNPDLRIEGDFSIAAGAQFYTGPYSPNQVDFYGAFTAGNDSKIGVNNSTSDGGYWNLANATSITLNGTTIRDMTNNWRYNAPRWDFGSAGIALTNANTFELEQDVVNEPRTGIDSRGSLQQIISNAISGAGGITKTGAATLILDNASNLYSGATTISAGILQASGGVAIGDSSAVTLANAQSSADEGSVRATLSLNASETIGSLEGGGATGGNVILNGNTLTIGGNDNSTTFSGVIAGAATGATQGARANQGGTWTPSPYTPVGYLYAPEPALGAGNLVKEGNGSLSLTNTQLFSGATTVNGGTLIVNGDLSNSSSISVADGATLGGAGTFGSTTIHSGGTLAPGNSPGVATYAAGLTLNTGSTFTWELVADTTAGRGTNFDGVDITGGNLAIQNGVHFNLILNGSLNGGTSAVNFTDSFWDGPQQWLLFDVQNTATAAVIDPSSMNLTVSQDGSGNAFPVDAGFEDGFANFYLSQDASGDIFLNYSAVVPEPATTGLLALLLGGWLSVFRRRRKNAEEVKWRKSSQQPGK